MSFLRSVQKVSSYAGQKIFERVIGFFLMALFVIFLLQVLARYAGWSGFAWTLEACLALWLWIIFFGSAFVLEDKDQVSFDLFYQLCSPKSRNFLDLAGAIIVIVGLLISFLPTWSYINFLFIKPSASLPLSMGAIYSIYLVFLFVVLFRYFHKFALLISLKLSSKGSL